MLTAFLGFLTVFLLMLLVWHVSVLNRNTCKAAVAQSSQHSEIVLLLRGIKAVGIEQVDKDTTVDLIEAMRKHSDAMEELAFQMDVAPR